MDWNDGHEWRVCTTRKSPKCAEHGIDIEAYYNPVTGEAVRYNRISMDKPAVSPAQAPQTQASAPY